MARSSLFPASVQPGKPILPPCPPGWTTVTFGDVLEMVERPIDLIDDVEYQLVTAKRSRGGVVARSRLMGREVLTKTQFQIARDDFLMSNRQIIHGGCGIVPPALDGAVVSNEYSVLRPKSRLLLEFLGYLSHSIYFQQTCFHASVGVDVEKMIFDCERWLGFKIHLPPLQEQRRIAEILSSVDNSIVATRVVIEQTHRVHQRLAEQLIGDESSGSGNINGGNRFKKFKLGQVASLFAGGTPSRDNVAYFNGDIPWVKSGELNQGRIRNSEEKITELGLKESSARIVPAGTPLVAMYGATAGVVGLLEIEAAINQAVLAVLPKQAFLNTRFCYHLLKMLSPRLKEKAHGSGQPNLNKSMFENFDINLPGAEEQLKIASILEDMDATLDTLQSSAEAFRFLKTSLLSDLLTGRKRVNDVLPIAAE